MEYAVIMAGGRGTRLWPFSRNDRPKQLLPIIRGKSLLQLSFERRRALLPADRIFVCTAANHRDKVLKDLPDLPPDNVLGEPEGRDTANAVGFPATVLLKRDPDADRYAESGRYYWNSGMFVWRCDTVLNELSIHLPEAYKGLQKIGQAWGTPEAQNVLNANYPGLTRKSIDYAVMEPASTGKG